MKATHQCAYIRHNPAIGRKDVSQIFPEGKIRKGIVLGKHRITAHLKVFVPEFRRTAMHPDSICAKIFMQTGENF